ncbi:ATP synthase F0 subcomplex B subunit [Roseiarcus fermentans]|uniref:ATP synthase subunit b n=1 Tax=Roseiarcus fermentans TaxID=1473586 RepID=A0A366F4X0_9HYPH|nr:F0F1 ATP synthase subunit delta [Roseiarcus fermentans]RBP09688.1 ATP synthase F0 subcomplex B subunit [Roseiarcus fermentans]
MRIDWWTLGLQTVNVLILVAILARFLFRPVIAIMEERRAAAEKILADAEAERAAAVAAGAAAQSERERIEASRGAVLARAAEEAAALREAALASAKEDADQVRAAAETETRWARAAEEAAASERSARLAVDVAGKLMQRLPASAQVDGFIDGLAGALASLPEASRDGFGAPDRPTLTAPRPLTAAEIQSARDAFARALGRPVDLAVAVDPSLIAGLELETPHAVARNSFRADLKRIVEELTGHAGDHR